MHHNSAMLCCHVSCEFGWTAGPIIQNIFDCKRKHKWSISRLDIALQSSAQIEDYKVRQTSLKIALNSGYLFEYVKQNLDTLSK